MIDVFLGGEFSTYGLEVLKFLDYPPDKVGVNIICNDSIFENVIVTIDYCISFQQRYDPMAAVFPRVAKCSFYKFGSSGTMQTHDTVCILPVNIMNEKVSICL